MFKLLIITLILVGIALLGLSFRLMIKKKSKFPEKRISHNKEMRNIGISCYKTQDKLERMRKAVHSTDGEYDLSCNCDDNSCTVKL
jgi:hypothetical protein